MGLCVCLVEHFDLLNMHALGIGMHVPKVLPCSRQPRGHIPFSANSSLQRVVQSTVIQYCESENIHLQFNTTECGS